MAMSGGIDSTMASLLLHEQGYEVIGLTMKTWDYESSGGSKKETGCCSLDSINDARALAVHFGFHHFILDIREEFGDFINTHTPVNALLNLVVIGVSSSPAAYPIVKPAAAPPASAPYSPFVK